MYITYVFSTYIEIKLWTIEQGTVNNKRVVMAYRDVVKSIKTNKMKTNRHEKIV